MHFAPTAASGREGPEPVHQMRVAVRRLRSAIKVFGRAVSSPAVDAADAGLKALAAKLAPTRDWDVFATETATSVAAAFPTEPRLKRLLAAVERRRRACHSELREFLASVEFRRLGIELACLAGVQDWPAIVDELGQAELVVALDDFAARVLDKRLKRLTQIDDELASLEPSALHAIRLRAKRLRYAAEIFAPLYPGKPTPRFIRRLGRLQDRLGTLNDVRGCGEPARRTVRWQPRLCHRPRAGLRRRAQRSHPEADRAGLAPVPQPGAVLGLTLGTR